MAENDYVAHPDGGIAQKDSLNAPETKPEAVADQAEVKPEVETETKPEAVADQAEVKPEVETETKPAGDEAPEAKEEASSEAGAAEGEKDEE